MRISKIAYLALGVLCQTGENATEQPNVVADRPKRSEKRFEKRADRVKAVRPERVQRQNVDTGRAERQAQREAHRAEQQQRLNQKSEERQQRAAARASRHQKKVETDVNAL